MRRVAAVASAAASCAVAAFVGAAAAAGAVEVSGFPLLAAVAGAALLVGGLLSGSGLALSLAFSAQVVGDIGAVDEGGVGLARAAAAGCLLFVAVDATRLSIDARRPSRFDATILRRLVRRTLLVAGAAGVAALVLAWVDAADRPAVVVTVALIATLALVAGVGMVGRVPGSFGLRLGAGILVAATVVGLAGLAASRPGTPADASPPTTVPVADPTVTTAAVGGDAASAEADDVGPLLVRLILFGALVLVAVIIGGALLMPQAELDLEAVAAEADDPMQVMHGQHVDVDEVDEDVVSHAVDVLDRTRLWLEGGEDPGRAVRFAYAQAETGFGLLDQGRRPTETELEFLDRMLTRLGASGPSMARLTELFAVARFSEHHIDEDMRRQAIEAVARVRADLVGSEAADGAGR